MKQLNKSEIILFLIPVLANLIVLLHRHTVSEIKFSSLCFIFGLWGVFIMLVVNFLMFILDDNHKEEKTDVCIAYRDLAYGLLFMGMTLFISRISLDYCVPNISSRPALVEDSFIWFAVSPIYFLSWGYIMYTDRFIDK